MNHKSEYNKRWKQEHPELHRDNHCKYMTGYRSRYPDKRAFTVAVYQLIKRGYLKREPCCVCGGTEHIQACTLSASPQSPVWFCFSCHQTFHSLVDRFGFKPVNNIGSS